MVVLKRNNVGDATHTDQDNWKWYIGADSYAWQAGNAQQLKQWDKSSLDNVDLKPIEKKEMKEFLEPHPNGKYVFTKAEKSLRPSWVEIPEGADKYTYFGELDRSNFYKGDFDEVWQDDGYWDSNMSDYKRYCKEFGDVLWQRETLNDKVASTEEYRESIVSEKLMHGIKEFNQTEYGKDFDDFELIDDEPKEKHSHYKKDISHLNILDVYRVLELFDVYNPCLQHAIKKLLCAGQRGAKDTEKDIQEAIDTLIRYKQMREEDNA